MSEYQTERRDKKRGYMNLIVGPKAMDLFELVRKRTEGNQTPRLPSRRFPEFDVRPDEVENRLLRLIEKLEQKRDDEDRIARLSEDSPEDEAPPISSLLPPIIIAPLCAHA